MRLVLLASAMMWVACSLPERAADAGNRPNDCITLADFLDLGVGELGTPIEKDLYLFNSTGRQRTFTSSVEPPFSTLFPTQMTVEPNQAGTIRIRFTAPDGRLHVGKFSYVGGAGCPTREVVLHGLGAGSVETDTPKLDFGRVPFGVSKTLPIVLRNSRRSTMNVTLTAAPVLQLQRQVTLPASSSLNIPVTVTAQAGVPIAGAITITATDDTRRLDEVRVEVRGEPGTPTVVVEPMHLVIARAPVGGPVERRITIRNLSQTTASVELREVTDGGAVLSAFMSTAEMGPASSLTVPLWIQAPEVGTGRAVLLVASDDAEHPEQLVNVDFTGEALFQCAAAINSNPVSVISATAMYPARVTFTFNNPTSHDCLLDDIRPTIEGWSLDTGETEQLLVPAFGSATRTVVIPAPGNGFLEWTTFRLTPVRQTAHIHLGP